MSDQHRRETVSAEQMTYSNTLTINAPVGLLDEHGILPKKDVLERINALQAGIQWRKP
jgi:hypothetical protein